MHAQPFYDIGQFFGRRNPFGRNIIEQIVTYLQWDREIYKHSHD